MTTIITRRTAFRLAAALGALPVIASGTVPALAADGAATERLAALEAEHGGRLGVSILNLATGARASNRADERFLICSTFKTLLAAFVLARVDRGEETLERRIVFSQADLVPHHPVTGPRVGGEGMSVAELCAATVTTSDNPAANLLYGSFGGPSVLTGFLRGIGDPTTRLDRLETALNEHDHPGDERDTTTPGRMLETMRALFFGEVLSRPSRAQLVAWHVANKTGDRRLRAGLPADWIVGCKTGTNGVGNANHVAAAWSPDRGAVLVTAYCEMPEASAETRDAVIAEVGRIAATV